MLVPFNPVKGLRMSQDCARTRVIVVVLQAAWKAVLLLILVLWNHQISLKRSVRSNLILFVMLIMLLPFVWIPSVLQPQCMVSDMLLATLLLSILTIMLFKVWTSLKVLVSLIVLVIICILKRLILLWKLIWTRLVKPMLDLVGFVLLSSKPVAMLIPQVLLRTQIRVFCSIQEAKPSVLTLLLSKCLTSLIS